MLCELNQIKTKDGLRLEGLIFESKHKSKTIALWLSGLNGRFSHQPKRIHAVAEELGRKGISFAIFDHRGLGEINSISVKKGKKHVYKYFGTSFERFEDSVLDIEAMIKFCRRRGYKKIFLFGHSTGANKSAYYILKKHGRGLSGIGLLGPMSDIPGIKKDLNRKYKRVIEISEKMVKRGKGNELLPLKITNGKFLTAARFLSIAREGMNEDTFPYYDSKRKFRWTKNVRLPVIVLIGSKEQYADRPVSEIMDAFRKQIPEKYFTGKIIKGANHGFKNREKELGREMAGWIASLR
ncbi:MAG TPA: DUF1749 domain-containing protein [Candidatus Paceibacterota bacterium]|nr:DUF1749 domain-containing protein [Candidatus Paceibacterota bacterium]